MAALLFAVSTIDGHFIEIAKQIENDPFSVGTPLGRAKPIALAKDLMFVAAVHVNDVDAIFIITARENDLAAVRAERRVDAGCEQ